MPIQIKLIIAAVLAASAFWAGWEWRDRSADLAESQRATQQATDEATAHKEVRTIERAQQAATQGVADASSTREDQIHDDYDARIAAALAGRDSELGRLRNQWAVCETNRLSDPAAAAAEAAEQDRLRRASAARIVRDCELAQSERNEAIDRYKTLIPTTATEVKP